MVFLLSIIYYGSESIQINVLPLLLLFSLWKLQSGSPAGLTMLNTQGGGWAISKAVKFFNIKLLIFILYCHIVQIAKKMPGVGILLKT